MKCAERKRIALTGGIACGKSLVAKYLNELGVETIDADDIVHELLPDPAERKRIAAEVFADPEKRKALEARLHPLVKAEIRRRISEKSSNRQIVESSNGGRAAAQSIDFQPHKQERSGAAGAASADSTIRRFDDSTISPRRFIPDDSSPTIHPRRFDDSTIVILPLLFETHWDAEYDIICCVASDREKQISRMMTTRGYTREEAEARLAAQLPVAEKAAKSHYVIENNGTAAELKSKVAGFVDWLKEKNICQTNSMFLPER